MKNQFNDAIHMHSCHNFSKIKKSTFLLFAIILFLCLSVLLCSCEAEEHDYDKSTVSNFIVSMSNMDFKTAYSYLWPYSGCVSEEKFIEEYTTIKEALSLASITFQNPTVEKKNNQYELSYTALLKTESGIEFSQQCSTYVMVDNHLITYIKYQPSFFLQNYESEDTIKTISLKGNRGEIITQNGDTIAKNGFSDTVYLAVNEVIDLDETLNNLRYQLDLTQKEIDTAKKNYTSAVENNYGSSIVVVLPHNSIDSSLEETLLSLKGVKVDRDTMSYERIYPYREVFAHITGYANAPDEDQAKEIAKKGFSKNSIIGKDGLEKTYNDTLSAKDGYKISIFSQNNEEKEILYEEPAQNGEDLLLSIDSKMQLKAYYTLVEKLSENQSAVVITLNPTTGGLTSLVSYPSYDPNIFNFKISDEIYDSLTSEESNLPLYNRATLGLYTPGSILKPFTAVPALESGLITTETTFPYTIKDNSWIPEDWHWPAVTRSEYSDPPLTLKKAITYSDNIFFSWIGQNMGESMVSYFSSIGIGESIDFDLPVKSSNLLNEGTELSRVMISDMAFGHGEILLTPIQATSMYTAFYNDGDMLTPYLVQATYQQDGIHYTKVSETSPTVWKENTMDSSTIDTLLPMLQSVVTEGTARSININGKTIAAKTGTAIISQQSDNRVSWICAFTLEEESPKMVLVMVDGPASEDQVKFRIAKALLAMEE